MISIFPVFLLLSTLIVLTQGVNNRPIIGIFTQPTTDENPACGGDCLYIAASYVKYIESAGARVVPINYYSNQSQLDYLLSSLNGFMFPGGGAGYPDSAQYVYDQIVEYNKKGDYFPLWGTCMGFEWLVIATTQNVNILDPKSGQMDAYNYSIPLDFTEAAYKSRIFASASNQIMNILSTQNVTMNNHHYGLWTGSFYRSVII